MAFLEKILFEISAFDPSVAGYFVLPPNSLVTGGLLGMKKVLRGKNIQPKIKTT